MDINNSTLKAFRSDFTELVKGLEEKYKVKIDMKNISYNPNSFSFKTEVINLGENANIEDAAKIVWEQNCMSFGLTKEMFGKNIRLSNGKIGKITKMEPRKYKYPIIVACEDGKSYKLPSTGIASRII